uniref:VLIG-type G domain-containing protein n=1 Tax=Schistocephalus solidus TaxID=70667 RepID=A0A183SWJ4_SCHSO
LSDAEVGAAAGDLVYVYYVHNLAPKHKHQDFTQQIVYIEEHAELSTSLSPQPPPSDTVRACQLPDMATRQHGIFRFFEDPPPDTNVEAVNAIDDLYALCDDPMTVPVKLVDADLKFSDIPGLRDYFIENSGFMVIGVIGTQVSLSLLQLTVSAKGSGKSSVLNLMANRLDKPGGPLDGPFPVETVQSLVNNTPATTGIDMYITQDRVILLDTQPLLSWAVTDIYTQTANENCGGKLEEVTRSDRSVTVCAGPGKWSSDFFSEMSAIQVISFLFSVCHVVIAVEDNLSSPELHRLIDRAVSFKPLLHVEDVLLNPQITGYCPSRSQAAKVVSCNLQPHLSKASETGPSGRRSRKANQATAAPNPVSEGYTGAEEEDGADEEPSEADKEVPGSDETGLGQTPSAVRLPAPTSSLTAQRRSRAQRTVDEFAEQADVRAFVNRLQTPVAVFLNSDMRDCMEKYKTLLKYSYPARARFASLARLGPRILRRHMALKRHQVGSPTSQVGGLRQLFQIRNLANAPADGIEDDKEKPADGENNKEEGPAESQMDLLRTGTEAEKLSPTRQSPKLNPQICMPLTEEEVTEECCDLISQEQRTSRNILGSDTADDYEVGVDEMEDKKEREPFGNWNAGRPSTVESFFEDESVGETGDGEIRALELAALTKRVADLRREHFDVVRQLKHPRLFLLPATNEKGKQAHILLCQVPFGCPEYTQCALFFQEAVFSTHRQHMMPNFTEYMWLDYARQAWEKITTSPLLFDYHRLLVNNT